MVERKIPIVIDRLSMCIAHRHGIEASCNGCGRRVALDLPALLERHGDTMLDALRRRLRCGACGGRDLAFKQTSPTPTIDRIW